MPPHDFAELERRLSHIRQLMRDRKIDAYLVPSEDAHQSEYLAPCDARRENISGFTGSAGLAIITGKKALLYTDGRYFLQASEQLSPSWELMKMGTKGVLTKEEWLKKNLKDGERLAVDEETVGLGTWKSIKKKLGDRVRGPDDDLSESSEGENLVDLVVGGDRPPRPREDIIVQEQKYTGESVASKLGRLRDIFLHPYTCSDPESSIAETAFASPIYDSSPPIVSALFVSALDEIAWLFNLRGRDIPFNPVFFSYALVTKEDAYLFTDQSRITESAKLQLREDKVIILPYGEVYSFLQSFTSKLPDGNMVLVNNKTSVRAYRALGGIKRCHETSRSPIMAMKAIKNEVELQGFRDCHIRDGAALCKYLRWLGDELASGHRVSEAAGAKKLEGFRAEQDLFQGPSFDTISSTGANAAIIHYKPDAITSNVIDPSKIYLLDSGGQYLDGTTDTTRTVHFQTPTEWEKETFTRVLKGHIAIDTLIFPRGTTGYVIDAMARQYLWQVGLDYRHGTGHGVGSHLNVHEGPQGIGKHAYADEIGLKAGMVLSNEPGYYEDGSFGIRIESLILAGKRETTKRFGDVDYLGFEPVTMVPIQTKMIQKSLLSEAEIEWVNRYHKRVYAAVSPLLGGDDLEWLRQETKPI